MPDNNVCFRGRIDIDVVGADPVAENDFATVQPLDDRSGHLQTSHEDALRLFTKAQHILHRQIFSIDQFAPCSGNPVALRSDGGIAVFDQNDLELRR